MKVGAGEFIKTNSGEVIWGSEAFIDEVFKTLYGNEYEYEVWSYNDALQKIKNLVLHHLFTDWLEQEKNVQNLVNLKLTIQNKQNELTGYKPVIGFKVDRTG